ncbi:MAG: hypothetical protein CVV44_20405 [Spirochaetae bacterium HGW-Spirochaetae-1]|jgi:hypothetical protein|nr:MAG: hypothetical protein CVV44_20405 [Spirochaetae bacterium HGW-Spirochaetae-1]
MNNRVKYNSQRDNINFGGKFPGFWQCFSTCSWMLISFMAGTSPGDDGLALYLDDVEVSIGKPGVGEIIRRKYNWIKGHTSFWWLVQQAGIEKWLKDFGVGGRAVFRDMDIGFNSIRDLLESGPIILGTNKIGGLPGGHIILVTGYTDKGFIVNDPYGDALTGYNSDNGDSVVYPDEYLKKYSADNGRIRCLYWRSNG